MADVFIHRCRLRVVRRGGWSWGPSPKRVAQQAVKVFPLLLAKKLAELIPGEETLEYSARIQVHLRMRMDDFVENVASEVETSGFQETPASQRFAARMEEALRVAFGIPTEVASEAQVPQRIPAQRQDSDSSSAGGGDSGNSIERLLLDWLTAGTLEFRLSEFSVAELESWVAALRLHKTSKIDSTPQQLAAVREEAGLYSAGLRLTTALDQAGKIRQQLILATRTAAKLGINLSSRELWQQVEQIFSLDLGLIVKEASPIEIVATEQAQNTAALSQSLSPQVRPFASDSVGSDRPSLKSAGVFWDAHISTALPFLLLGPLNRLGYFETLSAVLQAAKLKKSAPIFAAALAYKVLAPPERGWRRTGEAELAATVFAGMDRQIADESIEEFSRNISKHIGPIERQLTEKVVEGHATGSPVVLLRADSLSLKGFLLVDFPGCFPFAFVEDVEQLAALLTRMQKPVVLIPQETADLGILSGLQKGGITFVTDAWPSRSEQWKRVPLTPDAACWTNAVAHDSTEIIKVSRHLATAADESRSLWREFGDSRPSVARASLPGLERLTTLSASVALGILSWKLWSTRGRTTPQLALERFSDLDARVRFDSESVIVRLPMGRRYQELRDSGLLQPVGGVPWFTGRRVEFSGG